MNGEGSNCWAVHGNHTESGKPLLTCDPHLMKWLQSKWYMINIRWGDNDEFIMGGSSPGMPLFTYARTKYVAWGATAVNPDITDLFVEKIDGDNYFYDGEWHPLKIRKDVIKVRGGNDYEAVYRHTSNGVLMVKPEKDIMDFALWFPLEFLNQNVKEYSIRWVFSE